MKGQLITHATAILAKKKGFREKTIIAFNENGEEVQTSIINKKIKDGLLWDFNKVDFLFAAPTQSVLQKWLRENHNIDVWAQPFMSLNEKDEFYLPDESYSFYVFKDGAWITYDVDKLDFESALEEGLLQALKLI